MLVYKCLLFSFKAMKYGIQKDQSLGFLIYQISVGSCTQWLNREHLNTMSDYVLKTPFY